LREDGWLNDDGAAAIDLDLQWCGLSGVLIGGLSAFDPKLTFGGTYQGRLSAAFGQ
jgi:hypothetical protein